MRVFFAHLFIISLIVPGIHADLVKLADIQLPQPVIEGGKPLMQALQLRRTSREFSDGEITEQMLSDLLWAAFGINRAESGKRTAPSARNWQEIDIYVVMSRGTYLYDAKENKLVAHTQGDLRKLTGSQPFVAQAPLNLVYVADTTRMTGVSPDHVMMYAGADAAFISQNVYLFCASANLSTVVRGMVDRDALSKTLNIPEHCKIIFAQTVGHSPE